MENYREINGIQKKLSIGLRIDSVSPSHVHFSLFANMVLTEYTHDQVTRAKVDRGGMCMSVEEFGPFVDRLAPHVFTFQDEPSVMVGDLKKYTGVDLTEYDLSGPMGR